MKAFTDFFGHLDGRLTFVICAVVVAAVFIFSLVIMLAKRRRLPLGRITVLAALAGGFGCYYMTLCTADAAYAAGNAVMLIACGGILGLIGAAVAAFAPRPAHQDAAVESQAAEPAPAAETAPSAEAEKVLPLEVMMYASDDYDDQPLPAVELPRAAAPETGYDEIIAKAEQAALNGIGLSEAKALIAQISKLRLLPENAPDPRRRALAVAQQKIVNSVRR